MSPAEIGKVITERRWLRLTPDRLIGGLLVLEGLLLLSEHFRWFAFNQHKGWTVLIALASVGAAMLLMLLWFVASLFFRWRFQFSIRSLLVLTIAVAIPCSWLAVEMKQAREQREAAESLKRGGWPVLYDFQRDASDNWIAGAEPPGPLWMRNVVGDDFFATVTYAHVIDDAAMENLKVLNQLYQLRLSGITDAGLSKLTGLTRLRELDFNGKTFTDAGLENLKGLTRLTELNLALTQVTDTGLGHLAGLTQLQVLFLSKTKVTDAGLGHLRGFNQLQRLELWDTQVTDAGLTYLKGLNQLKMLNLAHTRVTDAGLEHLMGLSQLRELSLNGTKVTDQGVKKLQQELPNCKIYWTPPTPDEQQSPAVPAQPGG